MLSRFCLLLLLLVTTVITAPATADPPSVIVSDVQMSPDVLMPGDQGLLRITLASTASASVRTESSGNASGGGSAVSTSTEINPVVEQVALDGGGDVRVLGGDRQYRGVLGPHQSVTLSFLVEAPSYAGVFFPVLTVRLAEGETLRFPVPVNVNTRIAGLRRPALVLSQASVGPFAPGERATIGLSLVNAGDADASDVLLRIGGNATGLIPVGSRTVHVAAAPRGANHSFALEFQVDRSAVPGLHAVPVEVDYTAVDGTRVQSTELLGVDLRGRGELAIASLKTDPVRVRQGDEFDLIVRMDNTGTGDARAVSARVDLPLAGAKEAFVGTVRPGSNAPSVFALSADRAGEFDYTFNATYEDDWGTHALARTLHLSVAPSGGALLVPGAVFLAVAIGAVALVAWWRRKRRASHV
jgi:hypothetical protein